MSERSCGCEFGTVSIRRSNADMSSSDTMAKIDIVEDTIKDVGCDQIAALVIYDLPGRDCAAKASNGEIPVGGISTYKSQYIDRKLCLRSFSQE
jgi:cellulase/cellobiase CelA1